MENAEIKNASNAGITLAVIITLSVLGAIIYWNALTGPFVYDDNQIIKNNPLIRNLSSFIAVPWPRYLTYLSFALNYAAGGINPFDFHLVNVALHIANSFLVYHLAGALFASPALRGEHARSQRNFISITSALVFLTHPVMTGAVSYITQRFALLAASFYLITVIFYVKARLSKEENNTKYREMPYFLGIITMLLAQLTKETCFTIPITLALIEFSFFSGPLKTRIYRLVPFFSLFIIAPAVLLLPVFGSNKGFFAALSENQNFLQLTLIDPYVYIITQSRVAITYLRLLAVPSGLRLFYEYPHFTGFFTPQILISFAILSSLTAWSIYMLRRAKKNGNGLAILLSFGILWFFITNLVEAVVPLKDVIFEHRVYLPGIGFIIAFLAALSLSARFLETKTNGRVKASAAIWAAAAVIITVFSVATFSRNLVWSDGLIFWKDTIAKAPNTYAALNGLGNEYWNRGQQEEALELFRKAVPLAGPLDAYEAHNNLAAAYITHAKYDEAIKQSLLALKTNNEPTMAMLNLGFAFAGKKEYKRAESVYLDIIRQYPASKNTPDAYNALGNLYREAGMLDKAIEAFSRAAAGKPEVSIFRYNLAGAYLLKGDKASALRHFKDALMLDPNDPETKNAVAILSAEIKEK